MTDKSTQPRLDARKVSPDLYKAMAGLQNYIDVSGLDRNCSISLKSAPHRSMAVHTVSSCIPTMLASTV
jgi:hypothetical protein